MLKRLPSLIGVIHLPPLGGSPGSLGQEPALVLQRAGLQAVQEARLLAKSGFEGLILENFGDTPFFKSTVPPETIASLAVIAAAVRESVRIPLGINVLRNDARAALAIAATTGCDFIRVNVLSGVAATDQGIVEGDAAFLLRERQRLGAPVAILADVHVKHARSLSSDDLSSAIEDTALRSLADAVIISGKGTGKAVSVEVLAQASQTCKSNRIPYYVGSGASLQNLPALCSAKAGVIVSSCLRRGGKAGAPLEAKRVKEFVRAFKKYRKGK